MTPEHEATLLNSLESIAYYLADIATTLKQLNRNYAKVHQTEVKL